ncbi:AraC family transcriptional regulator [Amycolatopsis sp. NPDC088138]|uniref:AraC family transcriptional regulator n=1 Tax=Amycolatopsis sp. NPDC088138 TaxID=3363938 RepID=UPI00381A7553
MGDHLPVTAQFAQFGAVTVGDIKFLGASTVEAEDVGASYCVQLPLSGRLEVRHRGVEVTSTRELATVFQPEGGACHCRFPADCRVLCVVLDRTSVNAALTKLLDDEPGSQLGFTQVLDVGHRVMSTWLATVISLSRQAAVAGGVLSHPMVAGPLAEGLVNGFLVATQHKYSEALADSAAPARPAAVRAAIELVETEPRRPWTTSAIAEHCGIPVRTLQHGFRQHLGMSPMAYLREVRLRRVHAELRAADPHVHSVADIARRWGFVHLGRFAATYNAKYGRTPSATLRSLR